MQYVIVPVTPLQQNCTLLWCEETGEAATADAEPDAAVAGHVAASYSGHKLESLDKLFEKIQARAFDEIDMREPSEEWAEISKDIVEGFL